VAGAALATVAALVGALTGCGSGAHPGPDRPTATQGPPVSVTVLPVEQYTSSRDRTVTVDLRNHGAALARATLRLDLDVPHGRTATVSRDAGHGHWTGVPLTTGAGPAGHDTLSGSWTTAVPAGDRTIAFRLRPGYGPGAAGETLPLRVTLTADGRTAGGGSAAAPLATLTAAWAAGRRPIQVRRDGQGGVAEVTLTDPSSLDFPQVDIRPALDSCAAASGTPGGTAAGAAGTGGCRATGRGDLTRYFRLQVDDGSGWSDTLRAPGTAAAAGADVSVPLRAGAHRTVRFRVSARPGLPAGVTRADLRLLVTGTLKGAPSASLAACDTEITVH